MTLHKESNEVFKNYLDYNRVCTFVKPEILTKKHGHPQIGNH